MNSDPEHDSSQLTGNFLQLNEHRAIAIYQRKGVAWVADFNNGVARLSSISAWFSLNRRVFAHACRQGADQISPLSDAMVARIERLHRVATPPPALHPILRRARRIVGRWWRAAFGVRRAMELSCKRPRDASSPEHIQKQA